MVLKEDYLRYKQLIFQMDHQEIYDFRCRISDNRYNEPQQEAVKIVYFF